MSGQCLKSFTKIIAGVLPALVFIISGCQTGGAEYISKREPTPVVAATKAPAPPPEIEQEEQPKELFVRQRELKIRSKTAVNETGSVTDLNDPRAYLFGFERPIEVGGYIDVRLASNRADAPNQGAEKAESAAASPDQSAEKPVDEAGLLKALPNLDPGGKDKPVLVKTIKAQIVERFDNGDVLVMHKRRSVRQGQGSEITFTARVPAEALSRPDNVNTMDFADVDWRESTAGEVVERKSANWEDEYSLRLSGFDETRSKDALGLEEKREMLKAARDKLENEMKSFSGERAKLAKERGNLLEDKAKDNAKIATLEQEKAELQKKVDELTPKEESSGDEADASKKDGADKSDKKDEKKADKTTDKAADKASAADKAKDAKKTDAKKTDAKKPDDKKAKPADKKG